MFIYTINPIPVSLKIDRDTVARVVSHLQGKRRNLERSKRKALEPGGHVFTTEGLLRLRAIEDAIGIIKLATLSSRKEHGRGHYNNSTWDRWANGNQCGSFNSDDD